MERDNRIDEESVGSKLIHNWMSSTHIRYGKPCPLIILPIGIVYTENDNGPTVEPSGSP